MSDVFSFLQLFLQYNAFIYGAPTINLDLHTAHESIGNLSTLHEGQYAASWLKEPKIES